MLTESALNLGANAIDFDEIHLHSGDPGASGTANLIANSETAISLDAPTAGVRTLENLPVEITIEGPVTVSHYSLWESGQLRGYNSFPQAQTFPSGPGIVRITNGQLEVKNDG